MRIASQFMARDSLSQGSWLIDLGTGSQLFWQCAMSLAPGASTLEQ